MGDTLLKKVEEIENKHRYKKHWKRLATFFCVITAVSVAYALIIPAITENAEVYCGHAEHTHSAACYEENHIVFDKAEKGSTRGSLVCGIEEHSHTLACFSNPDADVESSSVWERTVKEAELTGVWADDVLAIADTQAGYKESKRNYMVGKDGTSIKGYTRYGDWYGDPYGDWCAMFCSFCISYAGIDQDVMPIEKNCLKWIEKLEDAGLYYSAGERTPEPGDLVFFDQDKDGDADHVGFVIELIFNKKGSLNKIRTIEGNNRDRVSYHTYNLTGTGIIGYGEVPDNPKPSELSAPSYNASKSGVSTLKEDYEKAKIAAPPRLLGLMEGYPMTYLKGTSDTVTNMPVNNTGIGGEAYTVSGTVPQREGYEFIDWTLDYATLQESELFNYTVRYVDIIHGYDIAPPMEREGYIPNSIVKEFPIILDEYDLIGPPDIVIELTDDDMVLIFFYQLKSPLV